MRGEGGPERSIDAENEQQSEDKSYLFEREE